MTVHTQTQTSFFQEQAGYHGVLRSAGDWRLAISPNGTRYLLQERQASGEYLVRRWRKQLSKLLPDLPSEIIVQGVKVLPENPGDYERPWASAMKAQGERVKRALCSSESYAGVIAASGGVRLSIAPNGCKYLLQERSDWGAWQTLVSSANRSAIFDIVFSRLHLDHKAVSASRNPALMNAVALLPERATSYRGKAPERLSEALKVAQGGGRSEKRARPSGGKVSRSALRIVRNVLDRPPSNVSF